MTNQAIKIIAWKFANMYFWNREAKRKRQEEMAKRNLRKDRTETNHWIWRAEDAREWPLEVIQCITLLKAQSTSTDSLGLCPVLIWKSPGMVTPQSLQAPSASQFCSVILSLEMFFPMHKCSVQYFSLHLPSLALSHRAATRVSLFLSLSREEYGHPRCKHLTVKIF